MQYYNLKKLQFIHTSKGVVQRKCVITYEYGKQLKLTCFSLKKFIFENTFLVSVNLKYLKKNCKNSAHA